MNYILALLKIDAALIAAAASTVVFALSDAVAMSLISSMATLLLGIASAYFAYRAKVYSQRAVETSMETHHVVNSRMQEMLELAKKSSKAEGVMEAETIAAKIKAASGKP